MALGQSLAYGFGPVSGFVRPLRGENPKGFEGARQSHYADYQRWDRGL
jgi:hypothetical protein